MVPGQTARKFVQSWMEDSSSELSIKQWRQESDRWPRSVAAVGSFRVIPVG